MHLDGLTLMVPGAFASAFAAMFLLGAWLQHRSAPALLWWASALTAVALGIGGIVAGIASNQPHTVMTGSGMTGICPILIWCGARSFNSRSKPLIAVIAMPLIWLAVAFAPFGFDNQRWATLIAFTAWVVYVPATVLELSRSRAEQLNARWPLMALLAVHALTLLGAISRLLAGTFEANEPPELYSWFGAIQFEQILFATGSAFFMALMCKERSEFRHKQAAELDPLTGVRNYGAFLVDARRILKRSQTGGSPCSLIIFDLDHFKKVNDTFGHPAGDRILQSFTDIARNLLRPTDLFGRYGGEEFLAILPDTEIEAAVPIAERIRHCFAGTHRTTGDGKPLKATVSAGVAAASLSADIDGMIEAADRALYMAKNRGRNRVERADNVPDPDGNLVRIA